MSIELILFIIIQSTQVIGQVTFQKGSSNAFYYEGNNLNLYDSQEIGRTLSVDYQFPTSFARLPQVYLVLTLMDQDQYFPAGYYLDINSITTEGFTVTVTVPHTNRYYGIIFNWYAFDDLRRIVISAFNQENPQPLYTFSHSNIAFSKAVVSLVSFFVDYGNPWINVEIDSVTYNSVSVRIQNESELKQIGFQILIGTDEAMYIGPNLQYQGYISGTEIIDYPQGWDRKDCIINIQGFAWAQFIYLRISTSVSLLDDQIQLKSQVWGGTYLYNLDCRYYFILSQWNPQNVKPMLFIDYFIQKIRDEESSMITNLKILTLQESIQSQTYIIDKQYAQELTFEITAKCIGQELWQIKLLQCQNKFTKYSIQCGVDQQFNYHKYIIQFRQSKQIMQNITATVTENKIQIVQNMLDYNEQNLVILDLSY